MAQHELGGILRPLACLSDFSPSEKIGVVKLLGAMPHSFENYLHLRKIPFKIEDTIINTQQVESPKKSKSLNTEPYYIYLVRVQKDIICHL